MKTDDKTQSFLITFSFFFYLTVFIEIIYYLFAVYVFRSNNSFGGPKIENMIYVGLFIITVFLVSYFCIQKINEYSVTSKEYSNFSFEKKYKFIKKEPEFLKKQVEDDQDLSNSYTRYYDYRNCITANINSISYSMNERYVSHGKNGHYEFICLIKHNKSNVPNFYLRKKYYLSDLILSLVTKTKSIVFPEDSNFSQRFFLKESISSNPLGNLEENVRHYFSPKVRDIFIRYGVYEAFYYSCESNELKIKVPRILKESEKEKIFLLAKALFEESE